MEVFKEGLTPTDPRVRATVWLEEGTGMVIISIATIYALFGDDLRLCAFPAAADPVFQVFNVIVFLMFSSEFFMFIVAKRAYAGKFFFWLDFVALITMLTDIEFIWNPIYTAFGGDSADISNDFSAADVAKAGRSAKAGARAGRVVRVIRIIRLMRVVKLYKMFKKKSEGDDHHEEEKFSDELSGSDIGKKLTESTTRICIIVVLSMLISFPILEMIDISATVDNSHVYKLYQLEVRPKLAFVPCQIAVCTHVNLCEW